MWGICRQEMASTLQTMLDKRLKRDRMHVEQNRKVFEKLDGKDAVERASTKERENLETLNAKLQLMKVDSVRVDSTTKAKLNNSFSAPKMEQGPSVKMRIATKRRNLGRFDF